MKFKKCFQILPELYRETFSMTANFAENIPYGEISINFQNDTFIKLYLNENEQIHDVIKYYDKDVKLIQLNHCDYPNSKWIDQKQK